MKRKICLKKKVEGPWVFLIRNKCDWDEQNKNKVDNFNEENINDFLKENKSLKYITTSAKDNTNINNVFQEISKIWLSKEIIMYVNSFIFNI